MSQPFVYFDLGMVLVRFDHQQAVQQLSEASGVSNDEIFQLAFASGLQERYETGLVSSAEYVVEVNRELKTELSSEAILEAISAIFEPPRQEILSVLEMLRSRDIPMAILSNTCEAHWQWICRQNWPIPSDWFKYHVLSYEVQSMKPNGKIYEVCEELDGRPGQQLFFTDDREENIQAAAQRNWHTHLFVDEDNLMSELQSWLAQW